MWSQHIPPDHVHVITVPPQGATDLLWIRFASVLGVDPGRFDLTGTRANPSLGPAEAEFLRQVNQALPAEVPDWFYTRDIKRILALDLLRSRPRQALLTLPASRAAWAQEQSDILIAGLALGAIYLIGLQIWTASEPTPPAGMIEETPGPAAVDPGPAPAAPQ